jgi:hypothetical protein
VGGPEKISHVEVSKYLVSLDDLMESTGTGFWRERRQSPIIITVDNQKKVVRLDTSSRYYSMERTGEARKMKVMERENREPIINPIDLPGRPQRMNETFTTNLRVNLGAYIPASLKVDRLQATLEGIEWLQGEPCVRIRLTYLAGTSKVDIKSVNITGADFEIQAGTTTIWFSETTQRVMKSEHDITGNLSVDVSQLAGAAGGYPGGAGGEFAPGGDGAGGFSAPTFGAPGGYPGAGGFGAPPGGAPGASGFGAPFGAGAPGGYPGARGARPPRSGGYPGAGGMGAPPGGYPGAGGYSGGAPGGAPGFGAPFAGAPGGYPGSGGFSGGAPGMGMGGYPGGAGAGTGITATIKRYFVKLKVKSVIAEPEQVAAKKS